MPKLRLGTGVGAVGIKADSTEKSMSVSPKLRLATGAGLRASSNAANSVLGVLFRISPVLVAGCGGGAGRGDGNAEPAV